MVLGGFAEKGFQSRDLFKQGGNRFRAGNGLRLFEKLAGQRSRLVHGNSSTLESTHRLSRCAKIATQQATSLGKQTSQKSATRGGRSRRGTRKDTGSTGDQSNKMLKLCSRSFLFHKAKDDPNTLTNDRFRQVELQADVFDDFIHNFEMRMMDIRRNVNPYRSAFGSRARKVPSSLRASEKACELETLMRPLREGYLVIINFREPVEAGGHYGLLQGINNKAIKIADPWYGRRFVLLWMDFVIM